MFENVKQNWKMISRPIDTIEKGNDFLSTHENTQYLQTHGNKTIFKEESSVWFGLIQKTCLVYFSNMTASTEVENSVHNWGSWYTYTFL